MGVVYEAVQQTLGRHMALKVLGFSSWNDPTHRERFRREVQAAAKLHHTNIVPVFSVGEENGIHYYAMQFIQGQTLPAVLMEIRQLHNSPVRRRFEGWRTIRREVSSPGSCRIIFSSAAGNPSPTHRGFRWFRSVARVGIQVADALN